LFLFLYAGILILKLLVLWSILILKYIKSSQEYKEKNRYWLNDAKINTIIVMRIKVPGNRIFLI